MKPEDSPQYKNSFTAYMQRKFALHLRSAVGWAGIGCLSYGCWLAWQPLGFIAGGALTIAVALLSPVEG